MSGNSSSNGSWNEVEDENPWLTTEEIVSSPHWYLSMAIELLIILINCWISVAFMRYVLVKKLLSKKHRQEESLIGGTVIGFTLAAVFLPFFRYAGTILVVVVGLYPEEKSGCEVANDLAVAGFALAIFPTYAYLWARQRAFYRHPSLKSMTGTCSRLLSKFILPLIMLSACASVVLGIYPKEYEHGLGGCVLIGNEEQDEYRTYVYAAVMISSQACLLGLFLYPIFLHSHQQRSIITSAKDTKAKTQIILHSFSDAPTQAISVSSVDNHTENQHKDTHPLQCQYSHSTPSNDTLSRRGGGEIIILSHLPMSGTDDVAAQPERQLTSIAILSYGESTSVGDYKNDSELFCMVKRVFLLSLIPIIFDLSTTLINQFGIPDDVPQTYSFVLFDVNVLIHVFTVVFSFEEWREIVSCCMSMH